MGPYVDISFDCLPLRSVGRLEIPADASPKFRARCAGIQEALAKHGSHNSYYLYNAQCTFHLTNETEVGVIQFAFDGTLLTDDADERSRRCDLRVELKRETCDWLTEPIVEWFRETVSHAVAVEFNRFIAAGDLAKTVARIQALQAQSDAREGFLGMYL